MYAKEYQYAKLLYDTFLLKMRSTVRLKCNDPTYWYIQRTARNTFPFRFNFLQFDAVFDKKLPNKRLAHFLLGLIRPSGKSSICH